MSARSLRRLQQEKEKQNKSQQQQEEEEEEEEEEEKESRNKVSNIFSAFDEEDQEQEQEEQAEEENEEEAPIQVRNISKGKEKKRMNHKRKKEQKSKNNDDEFLHIAPSTTTTETEAASPTSTTPKGEGEDKFVLSVDIRAIDPDREMEKKFGRKNVESTTTTTTRRPPNTIVLAKPNWPRMYPGACPTMEPIPNHPGSFRYKCGKVYGQAQEVFERAAKRHDLGAVSDLLSTICPWHADSLLQLSSAHEQAGEHSVAEDLIERCLFSLQSGLHHSFTLSSLSNCKVPFEEGGCNQTLLLAILRYSRALSRRGCTISAFECCKLGYLLDPTDPLGFLLLLDAYALRAGSFRTVLALSKINKNLPGPRFNAALAQFRLQGSSEKESELSGEMIERAISLHPIALKTLIEKQEEQSKEKYSSIFSSFTLFKEEIPESLAHVSGLFAELNSNLWKEPEVIEWVSKHILKLSNDDFTLKYKEERKRLYEEWKTNNALNSVYRHLIACDLTDSAAIRIPPEALREALGSNVNQWNNEHEEVVVPAPTDNILRLLIYTLIPWIQVPNAPFDPNFIPPPDENDESNED